MSIEVQLEYTPSGSKKLSVDTYKKISSLLLDKISEEILKNIQSDGVGVAKGKTPSGGAPMAEDDPTTFYPGFLRDHHFRRNYGENYSEIYTTSPYANYVINGHIVGFYRNNEKVLGKRRKGVTKIPPNPYHKRAVDKAQNEDIIKKSFDKIMKTENMN